MSLLTVGELRKLIAHVDDDATVWANLGDGTASALCHPSIVPAGVLTTPTLLLFADRQEYLPADSFPYP